MKGRNSASLTFHHPYYDPFWYMQAAQIGGVTKPGQCTLPGHTGFIVPVNPPHGSRITSLYHLASVRPAYYNNGGAVADFQIWYDHPDKIVDGWPTWVAPATWNAYQGYKVRLWRYNCLNFATNANYSEEYHIKDSRDLWQADPVLLKKLTVDRRHYSYFVTFEMWGGCRGVTPPDYRYNAANQEEMFVPQALLSSGTDNLPLQGYKLLHPVGDITGNWTWPAVFKFRGLRLGWVTDRPGHGGWG